MANAIVTLNTGREVHCTIIADSLDRRDNPGILVSYFTSPHQDGPDHKWYPADQIRSVTMKQMIWPK